MSLRLAVVSTYPPRRCGLASFAFGLRQGLLRAGAERVDVIALERDPLPERRAEVVFVVRQDAREDYREAARLLNAGTDAVFLQHEYGIYGGPDGLWVLDLVHRLEVPLITTLHTVLAEPTPRQRHILQELGQCSQAVVVMARAAAERLPRIYGVAPEKVYVLPHGVPLPPPGTPRHWKRRLGFEDRTVALTFGLLSPGKGIEVALEAVRRAAAEVPSLLYVVAGSTHPEVLRREGEAYRESLLHLVDRLGIQHHVRFINRYLEEEELLGFILAADIYVVPYYGRDQTSSGTLTFAMALGKAIISTPFTYAQEMLADGAGILVPFGNPAALAEALVQLACDPLRRAALSIRAQARAQGLWWPLVGARYLRLAQALAAPRQEWRKPWPAHPCRASRWG